METKHNITKTISYNMADLPTLTNILTQAVELGMDMNAIGYGLDTITIYKENKDIIITLTFVPGT